MEQISPSTAGHARLARRLPHILQSIGSAMGLPLLSGITSSASRRRLSSDQKSMQRVDLYIKVEVELEDEEKPERVAAEICRQIQKNYVVRRAELTNSITHE
jgi:hypothetical protein